MTGAPVPETMVSVQAVARRVIPLDAARTDGWFDKVAEGAPNFDQLCDIVGKQFVAFAVIAGVRITAIALDRRAPDASLIDFVVGEDEEHRLPLGEFRRRLATTMLGDEPYPEGLPEDPDTETLQAYIGFRYVLLAPLFGIRLEELKVDGGKPPAVVVSSKRSVDEVPLTEFRDLIRDAIRAELQRSRPRSPFAIDLEALPEIERAAQAEDWDAIVERLGAWPGPLSLLLRTAEGHALSGQVRSEIARALGMLGTAYAKTGKHDWGEEIIRLGIQWGQDRPVSGDLFRLLGESNAERDRHGQAIGLLRRSLSLGAASRDVLPTLARCFAARGKHVAALICVEEALAAGADPAEVREVREEAEGVLSGAWERFRERVPVGRGSSETVRPPRTVVGGSGQSGQ